MCCVLAIILVLFLSSNFLKLRLVCDEFAKLLEINFPFPAAFIFRNIIIVFSLFLCLIK